MKKLIVKDDVCIGCGACIAIDSAHFDFDEQGLSSVISNDNLDSDELKNAMSSCPVNAIKFVEEDNDEESNEEETCEGCEGHCHGEEESCEGCEGHCHHEE